LTFGTLLSSQGADAHRTKPFGWVSGQPCKLTDGQARCQTDFRLSYPARTTQPRAKLAALGCAGSRPGNGHLAMSAPPCRATWRTLDSPPGQRKSAGQRRDRHRPGRDPAQVRDLTPRASMPAEPVRRRRPPRSPVPVRKWSRLDFLTEPGDLARASSPSRAPRRRPGPPPQQGGACRGATAASALPAGRRRPARAPHRSPAGC
jgi:hypothetical protein